MPSLRTQSAWFWTLLGALTVGLALAILNVVLGWDQKWIIALLPFLGMAASIYTFRRLWKGSDHPAFHERCPADDRAA
ncbi:hypothetical protein [Glaciibacter flavus]|uniref:hypothetical protein n=1 Tax=Orlajensenia flava TaxID=2565934 RepID=UPI003B006B92